MGTGIYVFEMRCRDTRFNRYAHGHGFGVEAGDQQYLVSTLHQVFYCHSSEHLQLKVNHEWRLLNVTMLKHDVSGDVVVFRINDPIGLRNISLQYLSSAGLEIGQEVFIVRAIAPQGVPWPQGKYIGRSALGDGELLFEGISVPGMSGLPICFRHKDLPREPRVAGILTGVMENTSTGIKRVTACDVKDAVESINIDLNHKKE